MSKERADCLLPVPTEEEILAHFTDEELRQVGLAMGYSIPQGTKFHNQSVDKDN